VTVEHELQGDSVSVSRSQNLSKGRSSVAEMVNFMKTPRRHCQRIEEVLHEGRAAPGPPNIARSTRAKRIWPTTIWHSWIFGVSVEGMWKQ